MPPKGIKLIDAGSQSITFTNDVITSIDGDQLTDLRTAMSIYRDKRNAARVSLILRRQEKEMSLDIDLAELSI